MRIEIYYVVAILVIAIATFVVAAVINRILLRYFRAVSEKLKVDETTYAVTRRLVVGMVYFGGLLLIVSVIPAVSDFTVALLAGAGFGAIVVGLAAQETLSDHIAGISIAISRPFRMGDVLTVKGEYGTVEDISLRHTIIKTWVNKRLIIPNAIIGNEEIVNWSIGDLPVYWHVDFGIAYDADIDIARSIILDELDKHPDVMQEQNKKADVVGLSDFSVDLRAYFWVCDRPTAWGTGCAIRESVKKRFDMEGVEVPFPYRTIVYKKDMEHGK